MQHYQPGQMYSVYERPGGFLFFALNTGQVFAGRTDSAGNLLQTIPLVTLNYGSDIVPVENGGF